MLASDPLHKNGKRECIGVCKHSGEYLHVNVGQVVQYCTQNALFSSKLDDPFHLVLQSSIELVQVSST